MATFLKTKVEKNIGTTPIDILQTTVSNRITLIGCNIANVIDDPVTVDMYVTDDTSVSAYFVRGIVIPANSSLKVVTNGEKLVLGPSCGLRIVSNTDSSVDAVISYADII